MKRFARGLMALLMLLTSVGGAPAVAAPLQGGGEVRDAERVDASPQVGEVYWFDLSETGLSKLDGQDGIVLNTSLPDETLHWVPFVYAGEGESYVLKAYNGDTVANDGVDPSKQAANSQSSSGAYGYTYNHSLFLSQYNILKNVSWNTLRNGGGATDLIFGHDLYSGSFTLRAPTGGSAYLKQSKSSNEEGEENKDVYQSAPETNEWDTMLVNLGGSNYEAVNGIKDESSWCQDIAMDAGKPQEIMRVVRGGDNTSLDIVAAAYWATAHYQGVMDTLGYRPVAEAKNEMRVVEVHLHGGTVGDDVEELKIVVSGDKFQISKKAGDAIKKPTNAELSGWTYGGSDFELGDDIQYTQGAILSHIWTFDDPLKETGVKVGETYWFDLSSPALSLPGKKNETLLANDYYWVPFTYAGAMNAYVLNNRSAGVTTSSDKAAHTQTANGTYGYTYYHNLFVAQKELTRGSSDTQMSWNLLNQAGFIFGTSVTERDLTWTLRAPTVGNRSVDGIILPDNSEWDRMHQNLNKEGKELPFTQGRYIWGQDTFSRSSGNRMGRGDVDVLNSGNAVAGENVPNADYRPVLELAAGKPHVVELDLSGAMIQGDTSDTSSIKILVNKDGFRAPSVNGLEYNAPAVNAEGSGNYGLTWKGEDGKIYYPDDAVKPVENRLTAVWTKDVPTLTAGTAQRLDRDRAELSFTSDQNATYYYLMAGAGEMVNHEDVKERGVSGQCTANEPVTLTFDDLNGRNGIVVYVVAVNQEKHENYTLQIVIGDYTPPTPDPAPGDNWMPSPPTPSTYPPRINQTAGGTVTVSPSRPQRGDTVTITATPDAGKRVSFVGVTDRNGNVIEVTDNGNGTWTFTQPNSVVTVGVVFRDAVEPWRNPFGDVQEGDWFYSAVEYVIMHNLMTGTGATTFSPDSEATRAMLWAILARMDGATVAGADWMAQAGA